jgi:hypothetical protein
MKAQQARQQIGAAIDRLEGTKAAYRKWWATALDRLGITDEDLPHNSPEAKKNRHFTDYGTTTEAVVIAVRDMLTCLPDEFDVSGPAERTVKQAVARVETLCDMTSALPLGG